MDPYRRGKGGIGFLWKKNLTPLIHKINCGSDRISGISLQIGKEKSLTIFGVYLPDSRYGLEIYNECLDLLQDLYCKYSSISDVIILGDFNAQINNSISSHTDPRHIELKNMVHNLNLISLCTLDSCKGPGYSFCGYKGGPTSLIDHICLPDTKLDLVKKCEILADIDNLSDHLPVVITLDITPLMSPSVGIPKHAYNWKKLSPEQRHQGYEAGLRERLSNLEKPEIKKESDIGKYYEDIVQTMLLASEEHVPKVKYKHYLKPFWKSEDYVLSQLHGNMRLSRIEWINDRRPRGAAYASYVKYKEAKRVFRRKMRELSCKAEREFYVEIEQAASVDQNQFWKLVNTRRKNRGNCTYELKVDGEIYRNPDDILQSWVEYFTSLYSKTSDNDEKFNKDFFIQIEEEYRNIVEQCEDEIDEIMHEPIETDEVKWLIKKMKMGKAGGPDRLVNEHVKYGGDALIDHLTHLFNSVRTAENVPRKLKRGLLITLHKGSHKYSDDRRNHRGITLLNSIYKLMESLMLKRLKTWLCSTGKPFPNIQQGAYQPQLCSTMTSFNYQETIAYHQERQSKIYGCLLDTSTAFDTVWHHGLLVKLHRLGIKGRAWRVLQQCYTEMETAILYQGKQSTWIPVERSVRQGGVLSPWLYMVYINDLPAELEQCGQGCQISGLYCGSPIQADDVSLASPTVVGLQDMIDIVQKYAYHWQYELNPIKSKIMVFGENQKNGERDNLKWHLNGMEIARVSEEKHVGIILDTSLKSFKRTKEACRKGRNSLMSILNTGANPSGLNPITAMKLVKSIVLPSSLYGCELWNSLSENEIIILDRSLNFHCKTIQGLDYRTRSDICLAMAGTIRLQGLIAIRKLSFLGRLVWLSDGLLSSKIFRARALQYIAYDLMEVRVTRQYGFIPDITKLLYRYDLQEHWEKLISSGFKDFPTQQQWKNIVKKAVYAHEQREWVTRTQQDLDFSVFRNIHNKIFNPAKIWKFGLSNPLYLNKCRNLAKFIARTPKAFNEIQLCIYCGIFYKDIYTHLTFDCSKCFEERDKFWNEITDILTPQFSVYLYNMPDEDMYSCMLGGDINIPVSKYEEESFIRLSTDFLSELIKFVY